MEIRQTVEIRVRGTVQGVGFRPTVWRLACDEGLVGEVFNDGFGVLIRTTGDTVAISQFLTRLHNEAPPLSQIEDVETHVLSLRDFEGLSNCRKCKRRELHSCHSRCSYLRGLSCGSVGSEGTALRLSLRELYPLWSPLFDREGCSLRSCQHDDGGLSRCARRARASISNLPTVVFTRNRLPVRTVDHQFGWN